MRIIDLIYRIFPYGMTTNDISQVEAADTYSFRWFLGRESVVTFPLKQGRQLQFMMTFVSMLPGQGVIATINGQEVWNKQDLALSILHHIVVPFTSLESNVIRLEYAVSHADCQKFEDSRDLAVMVREFTVLDLGGEENALSDRSNLSSVRHLGDPDANAHLLQEEYEAGKTILESLPSVVTLALTTYCNNRTPCVICDRNVRTSQADGEVTTELIEKVQPLLATASYVLLHCGGEAMLSRYYDEIIKSINPPTRVSFATNAMLMTNKRVDLMLEKDIMAGFVVSLDAATNKTYKIMRPGSVFDTVIGNVSYYINRARQLGRHHSNITLNMTLCEANFHEAPLLVDLAESIGAWGVEFNHLNAGPTHVVPTCEGWDWDYTAQADFKDPDSHDEMLLQAYYKAKEKDINFSLVGTPFIGKNAEKFQEIVCDMTCRVAFQEGECQTHWESPHHKKITPKIPSCFKPWQETVIQPNGIVRLCYFHEELLWAVGNLRHSEFMQIWNSDQMVRAREQFLQHSFARQCAESQPCMHRGRK